MLFFLIESVVSRDVGYAEMMNKTGNMLTITIYILFILTDREYSGMFMDCPGCMMVDMCQPAAFWSALVCLTAMLLIVYFLTSFSESISGFIR